MDIKKAAMAGTLESSDVQITIEPADELTISLESSVLNQYGRQIKETVLATLKELGITSGKVTVIDKGALDCTLKARVACAAYRSCGDSETNIPWGGTVR